MLGSDLVSTFLREIFLIIKSKLDFINLVACVLKEKRLGRTWWHLPSRDYYCLKDSRQTFQVMACNSF